MILNRQRRVRIPVAELNRFLGAAQRRLRVPAGAVSVALVTDAEMKKWNRAFRGKNRATDVLSFPVDGPAKTKPKQARRARAKFTMAQPKLSEVAPAEHQLVTEKFITACGNGDLQALAAVLDPTVWGVGTVLTDPPLPPQINHGPHDVAVNLLRYLGPGVTVVSGPAGQPVLLAFAERRLFAVIVLSIRENLVTKIEATADPSARFVEGQP